MLLEVFRDQAKAWGLDRMKVQIERQKELGRPLTSDEERRALQIEIRKLTLDRSTSKKTMRNGGIPLTEFENANRGIRVSGLLE